MESVLKNSEDKMQKTLQNLEAEFQMIRAGRANPHLLDKIKVSSYGVESPLQQLANITVPEARVIRIKPWDKSLIKAINKAIMASDIGITPSDDGQQISLVFPELSGDRRKELVKDCQKKAEAAKVAIRNIRRDANDILKKMEKNSEITEDELKEGSDKIQKSTDKFIKKIDEATEQKSKEITTV